MLVDLPKKAKQMRDGDLSEISNVDFNNAVLYLYKNVMVKIAKI